MVLNPTSLSIDYVAGRLLSTCNNPDYIKFVAPFLVRVNADIHDGERLKFRAGDYVTVIAYVSDTERKMLFGMQRGGTIFAQFKAKYVTDVGDVGGLKGWRYLEDKSTRNYYYERSTRFGDDAVLEESHRKIYGINSTIPDAIEPRNHEVAHEDKESVLITTSLK